MIKRKIRLQQDTGVVGPGSMKISEILEGCKHGTYYCSTDKRTKCRQGPKKSRTVEGNKAQLGIPANASDSELKKIRSSKTASKEKKQRAHWLLNMRKGK